MSPRAWIDKKRPYSRKERVYSVDSSGHVLVDMSRVFASEEVRDRMIRISKGLSQPQTTPFPK